MAPLRRDEAPRPPSPGRARARTPLARLLVALVVSVIVGVVLEVGVFNLGHWATLGASPQELVPTGTVTVDGREAQTYDPVDGISRVEVQASYASSERQLFHVAFYAADEGSSTLHELGETLMYPGKELTCIKELHFFGEPSQIAVAVWLEGAVDTETADQYPDAIIDSVTVTADPHVPYDTSPVRLCLVTAVVLLALAVRRGGPLDLPSEEHPRLLRGAVLALVAGALVASAAMFLSKPLFTSVATPTYNAHRSTGEAVNSFEAFDRSLRYGTERYYEQARALAAGRASLLIDPPDWLEEMENPYDPKYMSSLAQSKSNATGSSESESTSKGTEDSTNETRTRSEADGTDNANHSQSTDYLSKVNARSGFLADVIESSLSQGFLNTDLMVCDMLEPCFMQVWDDQPIF